MTFRHRLKYNFEYYKFMEFHKKDINDVSHRLYPTTIFLEGNVEAVSAHHLNNKLFLIFSIFHGFSEKNSDTN